jgi:DNA-binding transcriptional LysR family regulator
MTLQQLRYFISVTQMLNFSAAAQIHYVSQSTISQQIKLLEEELGVRLFDRNKRTVTLTPAGNVFYQYSLQIFDLIDLATKSTKQAACGQALFLDVSIMPGLENLEAIHQFQYLKEKYPNLTCRFHRKDFKSSLNSIRQRQLDLALVSEVCPITDEDIQKITLPAIPNYIVVNRKSHLAKFSVVSREQLKDEPLYMLRLSPKEWTIITDHYKQHGVDHVNINYVDDLETLLLTLSLHDGYSILFEPALQHIPANHNLTFIPLSDDSVPVSFIWNCKNENPALAQILPYLTGSCSGS